MNKKCFLLFFFSFLLIKSECQLYIQLNKSNVNSFGLGLGNTFYVSNNQAIYHIDSSGIIINEYSDKKKGDISFTDYFNSLKIMLVFKDFDIITLLDSKLVETGDVIGTNDLKLTELNCLCLSWDNSIWYFDEQKRAVCNYNYKNHNIRKSTDISKYIEINEIPSKITEVGNTVFLLLANNSIARFDNYANYIGLTKPEEYSKIFLLNEKSFLSVKKDGRVLIEFFDSDNPGNKDIEIYQNEEILDAKIFSGKLYLLLKDKIQIISLENVLGKGN